jgi:hypothetical protein
MMAHRFLATRYQCLAAVVSLPVSLARRATTRRADWRMVRETLDAFVREAAAQ